MAEERAGAEAADEAGIPVVNGRTVDRTEKGI
jgi:hypothetical protein